ncbi:MAG: ribonuclease Y, partial [bacterium]
MNNILFAAGGLILFLLGWIAAVLISRRKLKTANLEAEEIIDRARKEAEREKHKVIIQAKEKWYNVRDEQEKKLNERKYKLDRFEKQLLEKEKGLKRQESLIQQKNSDLNEKANKVNDQKAALQTKEKELDRIIKKQNVILSRMSQLSVEEAKSLLLENLKRDYKAEAARIYKELVDEAKENAYKEAKKIITMAIEKNAADHCVETTVSVVNLPNEEIKGRIIGRDGRNIKAFETATGIKVIVDDTPEAVVLSGFDPVRREIARLALEKIIKNNKINPQRIEEIVKNAESEVEKYIWRAGNEAIAKVGVGRIHPDLIRMLGRLNYRTSYGQNVLQHSIEVATLVGAMAAELRLDIKLAKRAGLLHDIGKAMSQNMEGTHTQIGVEIAEKFNEGPVVVNAIAS